MKRNPGKMPDYRSGTKTFPERLLRVLRPVFERNQGFASPNLKGHQQSIFRHFLELDWTAVRNDCLDLFVLFAARNKIGSGSRQDSRYAFDPTFDSESLVDLWHILSWLDECQLRYRGANKKPENRCK